VSLLELTGYMRNTLLRDSDVFSMAHGLELRVPFLDTAVANAAASAADSFKLRRGASKPLLVAAVRDLLSPAVIAGRKKGFTLPFEAWMRGELIGEIESVLGAGHLAAVGLDAAAARDVWDGFQRRRPGLTWSRPWALYTLVRWARQHGLFMDDTAITASASENHMSLAG
jgi:asparagine synthase (glutamine-hydrolysing)